MPKISKIFSGKMPEFSEVCAIYMPKISTSAAGEVGENTLLRVLHDIYVYRNRSSKTV